MVPKPYRRHLSNPDVCFYRHPRPKAMGQMGSLPGLRLVTYVSTAPCLLAFGSYSSASRSQSLKDDTNLTFSNALLPRPLVSGTSLFKPQSCMVSKLRSSCDGVNLNFWQHSQRWPVCSANHVISASNAVLSKQFDGRLCTNCPHESCYRWEKIRSDTHTHSSGRR